MDKRIYSYKGFVFFGYICKEKREYKTLRVIYPPQLSVCELKVKVHLQGTLKKTYREKNGVSEWIWLFNVTFNDISSYMWRHIDVQADWRRSWTYGRASNSIDIS